MSGSPVSTLADPPTGLVRPGLGTAVGFGCAAAAILALEVAVTGGAPFGVDLAVRELVAAQGGAVPSRLASGLTQLGAGPILYPVLLVLCLGGVAVRRSPRELLPVVGLVAGQVLELVVFTTLRRPTPSGATESIVTTFSSGHTAAAVLGWGLIAWQAGRLRTAVHATRAAGATRVVWAVALSIGVLVGCTRVLLGLHWVSDAAVGVAVGSVLLAVVLAELDHSDRPVPRPRGLPGERWPSGRPDPLATGAAAPSRRWSVRVWQWARTSPWAWSVPAAAAMVPVGDLLITPTDKRMIDLLVYHGAGGTAGAGLNIYDFRTVFAMPFTYPPFGALVVEPLSRMPLAVAQAVWTAATLIAIVALAATVLRPVAARIGLPLTVAVLVLSNPIRSHLRFGQVGVFLVLLVASDLLRDRTGGSGRADGRPGWGLGLATAIKLTPAVFLPWLAVTGQWRRLAGTLVWTVGATALGLLLLWPSTGAYVFEASRDTTRFGHNDWPGNQSVRGILLRILADDVTAERLWLVAAAVLAAVGTYNAWRCERAGNRLAAVGVLAALSVAVSPISWVHHLVWLSLPIAAPAGGAWWRRGRPSWSSASCPSASCSCRCCRGCRCSTTRS